MPVFYFPSLTKQREADGGGRPVNLFHVMPDVPLPPPPFLLVYRASVQLSCQSLAPTQSRLVFGKWREPLCSLSSFSFHLSPAATWPDLMKQILILLNSLTGRSRVDSARSRHGGVDLQPIRYSFLFQRSWGKLFFLNSGSLDAPPLEQFVVACADVRWRSCTVVAI